MTDPIIDALADEVKRWENKLADAQRANALTPGAVPDTDVQDLWIGLDKAKEELEREKRRGP